MGVHGLWELLLPAGRRVDSANVSRKTVAVDISIWLTQFVRAVRESESGAPPPRNAHLLGVLRRCCKLLYLGVRPVFVFDGHTPALKRQTLSLRAAARDRQAARLRRIAEKLLMNELKLNAVGGRALKGKGKGKEKENEKKEGLEVSAPVEGEGQGMERFLLAAVGEGGANKVDGVGMSVMDTGVDKGPDGVTKALSAFTEDGGEFVDEEEEEGNDADFGAVALPEDVQDLDDDALVNLPGSLQTSVFRQIKVQQRLRHREEMLGLESDAAAFSNAQIKGFMTNTALNRRIDGVRKTINNKNGTSRRIASDNSREYVLEEEGVDIAQPAFRPRSKSFNLDGDDSDDDDKDDQGAGGSGRTLDAGFGRLEPEHGEGQGDDDDILRKLRRQQGGGRFALKEAPKSDRFGGLGAKRGQKEGVAWATRALNDAGKHGRANVVGRHTLGGGLSSTDRSDTPKLSVAARLRLLQSSHGDGDDWGSEDDGDGNGDDGSGEGDSGRKADTVGGRAEEDDDDDSDLEWEDGDAGSGTVVDPSAGEDAEGSALKPFPASRKRPEVAPSQSLQSMQTVEVDFSDLLGDDSTVNFASGSVGSNGGRAYSSQSARAPEVPVAPIAASSSPRVECVEKDDEIRPAHAKPLAAQSSAGRSRVASDPISDGGRENSEAKPGRDEIGPAKRRGVTFAGADVVIPPESRVEGEEDDDPSLQAAIAASVGKSESVSRKPSLKEKRVRDLGADLENQELQMALLLSAREEEDRLSGGALQPVPDNLSIALGHAVDDDDDDGDDDDDDADVEEETAGAKGSIASLSSVKEVSANASVDVIPVEEEVLGSAAEVGERSSYGAAEVKESSSYGTGATEAQNVPAEQIDAPEAVNQMSAADITRLQEEIGMENDSMAREARKLQSATTSLSEEMYGETRDLLRLLGLPYLEAPMEAEAQCAFLNETGLVDAVVTEDSDAFLFGAKVVYRRLFADGKFAESYDAASLESELGVDRDKLIKLALLLGSDYTSGVRGVGIVNAMEVLQAFPGTEGLREFKKWAGTVGFADTAPTAAERTSTGPAAVRRRFCYQHRNIKKSWEVGAAFPSSIVADAYLRPDVDRSTKPFSWYSIDVEGLSQFCYEKFGWRAEKFDQVVGPVVKQAASFQGRAAPAQTRIEDFFKPHRFAKIRSERLQAAVKGIAGDAAAPLLAGPRPAGGRGKRSGEKRQEVEDAGPKKKKKKHYRRGGRSGTGDDDDEGGGAVQEIEEGESDGVDDEDSD